MAPANVLQGAVLLHGLASSPTPETQVRVACALAGAAHMADSAMAVSTPRILDSLMFTPPLRTA
jgi:hypothetical protein